MAKLSLTRPRQFPDRLRSYDIVIDGNRVASIGSGKTVEMELAPGLHDITARIPWFGSNRVGIEVGPEGHHHFEVGNSLAGWPLLAIALLWIGWPFVAGIIGGMALIFWADPFEPSVLGLIVTVIVGIPLAIVLAIACVTRWRDRYLYLRQISPTGSPVPGWTPGLRWKPRLSVRGLMIAVLVIGGVLGLILQRARVQRDAVRAIKDAGGTVRYNWQQIGSIVIPGPVSPSWWDSLMTRLGPDYFGRVVWVGFDASPTSVPDDALMVHIARLDSLAELDFSPLDLSKANFASHRSVTGAGLAHLRSLPRLRRLNLSRTGVRGPGLAQLRGMSQLRWLELQELPLKNDDLTHLEGLTSREILNLSSNGITDEGLAHLAGLTKLKQLHLESRWITSAGLRHLSGMTQLTDLVLDSPRIDSLLPLEHLTELWWLTLRGTAIGDADLAIIARSKKLFHLDLSGTQIDSLLDIKHLTELEALHLNNASIGDNDLASVAGFKGLRMLTLAHTRIGDAGLAHLAALTELTWLELRGTRITDAGLASLTNLSKCQHFGLIGTAVTPGGVASLSAKLPTMRIQW